MAFHYFLGEDNYPSGVNCSKPGKWEQEQSKEEYQPELSAKTKQVQMIEAFPEESTKEEHSSTQEGNEGSHLTQDPQQLIVSADKLTKQKESTGGTPNSCTDTERVQKPATTTCKQKKATVEVLAATQPDGDQGIASRCKYLLLEVTRVFTIAYKYLLIP